MKMKTIVYGSVFICLGIIQTYETLGMGIRFSEITNSEITNKVIKSKKSDLLQIEKSELVPAGTGEIMAVSLQLSEALDSAYSSDLTSSQDTVSISVPYYIINGKKYVDARNVIESIEIEARKVKKYTITGISYGLRNETGLTEIEIPRSSVRIKTTRSPLMEVPDDFDINNPLGTLTISTMPYSIGG